VPGAESLFQHVHVVAGGHEEDFLALRLLGRGQAVPTLQLAPTFRTSASPERRRSIAAAGFPAAAVLQITHSKLTDKRRAANVSLAFVQCAPIWPPNSLLLELFVIEIETK
jgi:hypothetical protein